MESTFFALKQAFSLKMGMYIVFFSTSFSVSLKSGVFVWHNSGMSWFSETVDFTKLAPDIGIACIVQDELPDMVHPCFLELRWIAIIFLSYVGPDTLTEAEASFL